MTEICQGSKNEVDELKSIAEGIKKEKMKIAQDEESNISKQIKESEARSEKWMFEFIKGKRGIEGKQWKGNRRKQYDVPNWKD